MTYVELLAANDKNIEIIAAGADREEGMLVAIGELQKQLKSKAELKNLHQANAVMEFVNNQIGAFDSGFVDGHNLNLSQLYRFAQHHVKDNYQVETKLLNELWGETTSDACKSGFIQEKQKPKLGVDCVIWCSGEPKIDRLTDEDHHEPYWAESLYSFGDEDKFLVLDTLS